MTLRSLYWEGFRDGVLGACGHFQAGVGPAEIEKDAKEYTLHTAGALDHEFIREAQAVYGQDLAGYPCAPKTVEVPAASDKYSFGHVGIQGVSFYQVGLVDADGTRVVERRSASITLAWEGNKGFGEIKLTDRGERGLEIEADPGDAEFVKALLCYFVDTAKFV